LDIEFFLKERNKFSLYFYEKASKPFIETMLSIENEKDPYIPPYSEDGEPPFLAEWLEARDGLNSVGLATISMLSSAIQLFLSCWADRIESKDHRLDRKGNKGWLNAYKKITMDFGVDYSKCPASLDIIEQTVLARNRTQHSEEITSHRISHSKKDLSKYPSPYFISDEDLNRISSQQPESWWMMPDIHIDHTKLKAVILEIEKYCSWLESEYERLLNAKYA